MLAHKERDREGKKIFYTHELIKFSSKCKSAFLSSFYRYDTKAQIT